MIKQLLSPLILKQLLLMLAQLMLIVGSVLYIKITYEQLAPDKNAKAAFTQTYCTILKRKLSYAGRLFDHYRADFLVSYHVAGRELTALTSGSGIAQNYVTDYQQQVNILQQFMVGNAYFCWYDPLHPEVVILVLRHNWLSTLPLLLPIVIAITTSWYLLLELYNFYHNWCLLLVQRKIMRR